MPGFHEDDRRQSITNIFPNLPNWQVNVSYINNTEQPVGWHAHKYQTDYWYVLKGSLKCGLAIPKDLKIMPEDGMITDYEVKWKYLSDKNPYASLIIPPGIYHGYRALEPGTIILYGLDHKWDVNDEWKLKPGAFGEDWATKGK